MNNLNAHDDLIQAYLSGTLSKQDRIQFELELESNPNLKVHFLAYIEAQESTTFSAYRTLKQKLEKQKVTEVPINSKSSKLKFSNWVWLAIGLLSIALLAYFLTSKKQDSADQLFAEYYQAPPIGTTRSGESFENPIQKSIQHYEKSELDSVLSWLDKIPSSSEEYNYGLFIKCIALIDHQKYSMSVKSLEELLTKDDPRFSEMSEWYLSLSYLISEQHQKSVNLLTEIAKNPNHDYSSKSQELLMKVRKR